MANNQFLTGKARPVPRSGEMVLDPGPRNPIQTNTTAAVGAIRADERAFVSADLGRARIGQAIEGVGEKMTQLALKQMEAVNIRKEADADNIMLAANGDLAEALAKEPDETKWSGVAAEHIGKTRDRVLKEPMSPVTKAAVEGKLRQWEIHRESDTKIASARESVQRAQGAIGSKLKLFQEQQNLPAHEKTVREAVELGYMPDEAGELARIQFGKVGEQKQKDAKAQQADAVYGLALQNPEMAEAEFDTLTEGLDPRQKDSLKIQIRQEKQTRQADEVNSFSDRMASGEFKTLTAMQAAFPETMRPTTRKGFEASFVRAQAPGIKVQMEADAPKNFARFADVIEGYKASEDKDGTRYAQIVMSVKQAMPEELRGELLGPLYKKRVGGEIDAPEPLKQSVRDIVGTMFEAGAFGQFNESTPPTGADTKWGWKENPVKKADAYAKKGSAMIYMAKWMGANPNETPEKAHEVLRGFLSGDAPPIRSTAPIIKARPAFTPSRQQPVPDYDMDLPDSPGGPDGSLIPFFLPETQQSR